VLTHAWKNGFTCRSNYARENAEVVALAACRGLITTHVLADHYGQTWRITAKGLRILEGEPA
jgi:hypothetical protein